MMAVVLPPMTTTLHTPYVAHRPWLSMYNVLLRPPQPDINLEDLSDIERKLTNELLLIILGRVSAYQLGRVACVCRQFRGLVEHPSLWQAACRTDMQHALADEDEMKRLVGSQYLYSWKRMYIDHPHLRFDGLYVSRNQYVKNGVLEFGRHGGVHIVVWFRYYRFFPDGTFLYRTTPSIVSKVARTMRTKDHLPKEKDFRNPMFQGRYLLKGTSLFAVVVYPNSKSTEIRSRLTLRSTKRGANDRLDIHKIVSYDRDDRTSTSMLDAARGPDEDPDSPAVNLSQGLTSCVFVPWEGVASSQLNLPASAMDFFVPG